MRLWMMAVWMVWLLVGFMALFTCHHAHNPSTCAWSHVELVEKTAHSTTRTKAKNNPKPKNKQKHNPKSSAIANHHNYAKKEKQEKQNLLRVKRE